MARPRSADPVKTVTKRLPDGSTRLYFYDRDTNCALTEAEAQAARRAAIKRTPMEQRAQQRAALAVQLRPLQGPDWSNTSGMTLGELLARWQESLQWHDTKPNTKAARLQAMALPVIAGDPDTGDQGMASWPLSMFDVQKIRAIRDGIVTGARGPNSMRGTANNLLATLSAAFTWGCRYAGLAGNPCRDVERFRASKGHVAWSDEQITAYLAVLPPGFARAVRLGLRTSMRGGDLRTLTWGDYDVATGIITKLPEKTERHGAAPMQWLMPPRMRAQMEAWRAEDEAELARRGLVQDIERTAICHAQMMSFYEPQTFRNTLRQVARRNNLPRVTLHGIRATVATRLIEAGASEQEVMAMTGHANSKTLQFYLRSVRQKKLASAMSGRLESILPEVA
jgi:integrase